MEPGWCRQRDISLGMTQILRPAAVIRTDGYPVLPHRLGCGVNCHNSPGQAVSLAHLALLRDLILMAFHHAATVSQLTAPFANNAGAEANSKLKFGILRQDYRSMRALDEPSLRERVVRWWNAFRYGLPSDFDRAEYLSLNPDVAEANVDPIRHFLKFGRKEGRSWRRDLPRGFDPAEYLSLNPDVAKANADPLQHFLEFGREQGRRWKRGLPRNFDPAEYLRLNPDLAKHNVDPVRHFLDFGRKEGRTWKLGLVSNVGTDETNTILRPDIPWPSDSLRSDPVCVQHRVAVNEDSIKGGNGLSPLSGYRRVSLLVPTRNRPEYLKKFIASYFATTSGGDDSEIVFRIDFDDPKTLQILAEYDFPVIIGPRRGGYRSLPSFYNEMARLASGDILMCCNDDVIIETPGWPQLIIEAANKYPDGIFNIGVSTVRLEANFVFSCVSRKFVERLGFINDERLVYSDIFLMDVAKHFGRLSKLWSVTFRHNWAGENPADMDDTRADARLVEFEMVLADATGTWRDEYRSLHDSVVAEAVARIGPAVRQ
jgi:Glycosyl transferase family 2